MIRLLGKKFLIKNRSKLDMKIAYFWGRISVTSSWMNADIFWENNFDDSRLDDYPLYGYWWEGYVMNGYWINSYWWDGCSFT